MYLKNYLCRCACEYLYLSKYNEYDKRAGRANIITRIVLDFVDTYFTSSFRVASFSYLAAAQQRFVYYVIVICIYVYGCNIMARAIPALFGLSNDLFRSSLLSSSFIPSRCCCCIANLACTDVFLCVCGLHEYRQWCCRQRRQGVRYFQRIWLLLRCQHVVAGR